MTVEALVAGGDPFEAVMARSRAELKAVLQQTEAARATLAALQATLAATQKQVADLQAKAADLSGKVADAEKRAGELVNAAKTEAGVIRARAAKEAKAQLDDVRKRLAAARALLEAPEMGSA